MPGLACTPRCAPTPLHAMYKTKSEVLVQVTVHAWIAAITTLVYVRTERCASLSPRAQ